MPKGIIVDGQRVRAAGAYVDNSYREQESAPSGQGVVAVVGDFNFLEQNVAYVSNSKLALEQFIAPNEPDLMRISRVAYKPSRVATFGAGSPAAIVLISPAATTQAVIDLPTSGAVGPEIKSKIWGPRGNASRFVRQPRTVVPGCRCLLSIRGYSETIDANAETAALSVTYDYTPPGTLVANRAYGFNDDGAGTGKPYIGKNDDTASITFLRTIPYTTAVSNVHASWLPDGPCITSVTVTAKAGMTLSAPGAVVKGIVIGLDTDGLPKTTNITLTPDDLVTPEFDTDVSTSASGFSTITEVRLYPDGGTISDGNFAIAGTCFTLNAANNVETVEDDITKINAGNGFVAVTRSMRASRIGVAELDELAASEFSPTDYPAYLNASVWSIVEAVNEQSILVEMEAEATEWITPVATWTTNGTYVTGDLVRSVDDGQWYECISGHTDSSGDK